MKEIKPVLLVFFTTVFSIAAQVVTFDSISSAEQIYGEKITPADIKGKVIFFEYWGIKCPPCLASIPQLVDAQKKYAKTGKFTVIASHVQGDVKEAKDFCRYSKVNFPVFQRLNEPNAPCGQGIPSAFIIDHNGNVVEKGHPAEILGKIEDYIKKAPDRYFMISETEVKQWKAQAKLLAPNKSILAVVNQLKQASLKDDEKGKEASAILDEIEKYIKERTKTLAKTAETKPVQTFIELQDFLILVKGMEQENDAKALSDKLKADADFTKFLPLVKEYLAIQEKLEDRPTKALEKQLEALSQKIEKFKTSSSTAIATEAKSLLAR